MGGALLSHAEAAARCKVTRQRIEELIGQGRLKETDDGKIDSDELDALFENMDPSYQLRRDAARAAAQDPKKAEAKENVAFIFNKAKASREGFKAQIAKLEYEKLQGSLVPRDQVKAEGITLGKVLATRLENLSRKCGPAVAPLRDANECAAVIDREVRAIITEVLDALDKI